MKRHLGWIRFAAAAAIVAAGPHAVAQYAPYQPLRQYSLPPVATTPTAGQPQAAVPQQRPAVAPQQQTAAPQQRVAAPAVPAGQPTYMAYQPKTPQQTAATPYRAPGVTPAVPSASAYPQVASAYPQVATADPQTATTYSPAAGYPQTADRYSPYYTTVAQESEEPMPAPEQNGTLPPPAANGLDNGSPPPNGEPMNGSTNGGPTNGGPTNGATNGMANGHDMTNGDSMPAANGMAMPPTNGHNGYPTTTYNGANCDQGGYPDYGLSGYFNNPCHDAQWFGGVYYLFMERDDASFTRLAVQVDSTDPSVTYPYYPPATRTVLSTGDVEYDFRSGAEIRFGSTFTIGSACDTQCASGCGNGYGYGYGGCNTCAPCQVDVYAWEAAYWGLDDDLEDSVVIDGAPTDTNRIYGMKNFAGLEYDRDNDGTYDNNVNWYFDYQMPIVAPVAPVAGDIRVVAQRVRTNFSAQNIELNFLRLPMMCGTTSCNTGCAGYGGYGAGDSGYGACGVDACQTEACGSSFSLTGLCGVRYVRIDDDFQYGNNFIEYDGAAWSTYTLWDGSDDELYYDVNVDNEMVGFQLGANMNYCIACKWNLFWDTNFGLYGNHMSAYQRVYGAGTVRYVESQESAAVRSSKDDVSFLGEMRLGGSYDFTCHWRGVLAYRAVAISGVALSAEQIPQDFANAEQVGLIDSNGSIIIHGVQVGAECRY